MEIKKYIQPCIETMQELIRIKTVEDTPVVGGPFGQGNKDCLEKALEIAKSLGFKVKNLDGYCGYAEIGEGDELMGIIGHLDVVPEGDGWKYPPYEARIVDGVMYGRGTWDDKGPAVMSMYALKALMDSGFIFNKRVRLIFGCNEESGSKCMEHYLKVEGQIDYGFSPDADFPVIFGEKSITGIEIKGKAENYGTVKLESLNAGIVVNAVPDIATFTLSYQCDKCKARALTAIETSFNENHISFEVAEDATNKKLHYTVHGKACHGSIPQFGVNAASFAILAIKDVVENDFVMLYSNYIKTEVNGTSLGCYAVDEYGDIAVNIGLVRYEQGNYSIKINSRLPFTTTPNRQYEQIKETLKNENCEVTLLSSSNGFIMDKNCQMIQSLMKAYQEVTHDKESQPKCIAGGTYAREFNNCVAYGPEMEGFGDILIHQPNESIPLSAIETVLTIYSKAIAYLVSEVSYK